MRVLFVLKRRTESWGDYGQCYSGGGVSSGLFNSATFVCDAINGLDGTVAKLVEVIDNNCIDREVTLFKPDVVIIEAYWVVPTKFDILTKLHPKVKWIVRNHSELAFLANEGIAMEWTREYVKFPNVYVSGNNPRCNDDFKVFVDPRKVIYLPNYYPIKHAPPHEPPVSDRDLWPTELHVFCPGAIRPLKNQLGQAVAAMKAAKRMGRKLHFWINGGRLELNGGQVLKNLRALFADNPNAELCEMGWLSHKHFLMAIQAMDVVMQVSFTETFNIVSADAVAVGVPLVASPEIVWSDQRLCADPTNVDDMAKKIEFAIKHPRPNYARRLLWNHVHHVPEHWVQVLGHLVGGRKIT